MKKWGAEGTALGTIVIVHGAMEHQGRYQWLIDKWCQAGYHVIIGDLPGQGMTSRTTRGHIYSFNQYTTLVKEWIQEAYKDDLPVFLIGHSMGGLIVARLLQETDITVAGVILSSPCFGLVKQPAKLLNLFSYVLNITFPSFRIDSGLSMDMATRNGEVIERGFDDTLYVTKVSVRWYRELAREMKEAFNQIDDFQDIPILVMQGGDDRIVKKSMTREWFNYCPASEKHYKEWPKFYHEIFNEPEREDVFEFSKGFVEATLRNIGYVI